MKSEPPDSDSADWQRDPLAWGRARGHAEPLLAALKLRERRAHRRKALFAGAVAVLLVAAGTFLVPHRDLARDVSRTLMVTRPERRLLPDRSSVEIRPDANIEVNFSAESPGERAVTLTRGAALFQVEKNAAREFVVTAGGLRFRAVGTAFAVDLRADAVDMLVTEGRVAVEKAAAPGANESIAILDAGQRIQVSLANPASAAIEPATADRLDWRIPRLEFNETPLGEVVRQLREHGGANLRLASPRLARLEISGTLRADNADPLLAMLEANYRIRIVRKSEVIELWAAP